MMLDGKYVILCTGGIGSGKSVVVRVFRELGVPCYDCDSAARELYGRDPGLLASVVAITGDDILDGEGRLDRAALAGRIFSDASLLGKVEALVHPAVIRDFRRWSLAQDSRIVLIESAILLEKPAYDGLADKVLAVAAPEQVRIRRVMRRDGCSEQQVRRRMAAQWSDARRAARADVVLENNDRQRLLPAVSDILKQIETELNDKNGKD